jgi:adenine-specific DNA-methyltransferase
MHEKFIKQPLISYLGNKRKLIHVIDEAISAMHLQTAAEPFSGSGVVSRLLITKCEQKFYVNDLEAYCETMSRCFLSTPSVEDQLHIKNHIHSMNACPDAFGVISELYAPRDSSKVQPGERMFYTSENSARLDGMLTYVSQNVPRRLWPYCLAPLIIQASIRCNTSGVFNAFHKAWGGIKKKGSTSNVNRIVSKIEVECPTWFTDAPCVEIHCEDALRFIERIPPVDLVYLDPPYNRHSYGSNYFMLNVLLDACDNKRPKTISNISGIPADWKRSLYYKKREMKAEMERLLDAAAQKAPRVLISFNNEGYISPEEWIQILDARGTWRVVNTEYKKYGRSGGVTESLYILNTKTF